MGKDPDARRFEHRPFSLTVQRVRRMPEAHVIGNVSLTAYIKMPREQALAVKKMIEEQLAKPGDEYVMICLDGIMK